MNGTGIVLERPGLSGLIAHLGRNRVREKACGTCRRVRNLRERERYGGFCLECLERSRIDADDDIGGES